MVDIRAHGGHTSWSRDVVIWWSYRQGVVIWSDGGHTFIWSYGYMVIQSWYTIIWSNVNTVMVKGHGIW